MQSSDSPPPVETSGKYRSSPPPTDKMPGGIPYIVGNEAAERFSFYGMRAILYVFMTQHLLDIAGNPDPMGVNDATIWVSRFNMAVYFFPILGAILSDWLFGKYRIIILLSLVYCAGHAVMALVGVPHLVNMDPRMMLIIALTLIAVGAGGIKPCVSAHVGDQFGVRNQHLLPRVFQWFYFSINVGAALSMILTPRLLENFGPDVAFGVPGVLMALATLVFWMGRYKYVHVPPSGTRFFAQTFSPEGLRAMRNLIPIYIFVAMFWSLFDQTQSRWVEQAKAMDRIVWGFDFNPAEIQAINSIFVITLIPIFTYVIYPWLGNFFAVTPLRKISIGLFISAGSFAIAAGIQEAIDVGATPHIMWQVLAYLVITAAEVMVSITALELSYTQAPKKMKSFIMGIFMLSITLGNLFVERVNVYIKSQLEVIDTVLIGSVTGGFGVARPDVEHGFFALQGANYYWFFTIAMVVTACIFVVWSQFYRGETYIQGDD